MQNDKKKIGGSTAPAAAQFVNGNAAPSSTPVATGEYDNMNYQTWKDGGTGYAGQMEQAAIEAEKRKNDSTYGQAYTFNDLVKLGAEYGIDASRFYVNPARGRNSDDPNYVYTDRTQKFGASGMDEFWMNDGALDLLRKQQEVFKDPNATAQDKEDAHRIAEGIRAMYKYSGGADGSMYISNGEMDVAGGRGKYHPGNNYYTSGNGLNGSGSAASGMQGHLDAWQQAAIDQSNAQVDYAVQKAVADLERALADAQIQYKEQAESVDRNARQAMDNSALYAEMRGDKGGIGQEQYNSIQNAQARNHLAVQQAQTKLATDTQRQIADLRAQGEFQKADAALTVAQEYLSQLVQIEKWAAEFGLSVEEFQADLAKWQAEYDLSLAKLDLSRDQWQYSVDEAARQQLAAMGEALVNCGIMPDAAQLEAMNMSEAQARAKVAKVNS